MRYTLPPVLQIVNNRHIFPSHISFLLRFAPGVLAAERLAGSLPSLRSFREQAPPDQRAPWDHAIRHVQRELRQLASPICAAPRPSSARQVRRVGSGRNPRAPRQPRGSSAPPGDPGGDGDPDPAPPAKTHSAACISWEVRS
jgi:hypothetical protein